MTGAAATRPRSVARLAVDWRPGATKQPAKRVVIGTFIVAFAERFCVYGAEHGPAARIDNCDHNLRGTRRVEHDSVALWAPAGDLHELAHTDRVHRRSVPLSP